MLGEAVTGLKIKEDGFYVDGTFGRGGHTAEIIKQLSPQGKLLLMDRDQDAITEAQRLYAADPRVVIAHNPFSKLPEVLTEMGLTRKLDGYLLDLGVSSPQLDHADRGFSFMRQGPLDMRMDQSQPLTAAEWLRCAEQDEIARVLWEYGDERQSRKIARAIIHSRDEIPLVTTSQLAELVQRVIPGYHKKHPATRTFQAIRIHINQELQELKQALEQSLSLLSAGGRVVVISFHSLEDRMVKQFFRRNSGGQQELPPEIPIRGQPQQGVLQTVGKRQRATAEEIDLNPRSRSAVLRVAERTTSNIDKRFQP